MFHDGSMMMGGYGLPWLLWLLLIGVLLYFVWSRSPGGGRGSTESPQEILRRRLASGEITPQEYEERRTLLDRDSSRPS